MKVVRHCGSPAQTLLIAGSLLLPYNGHMNTFTTTTDKFYVAVICRRCQGNHDIEKCPHVKAIEYDENHRIKRIEFLTPADYMPSVSSSSFPLGPVTVDTTNQTHIARYGDDVQKFWTTVGRTYQ